MEKMRDNLKYLSSTLTHSSQSVLLLSAIAVLAESRRVLINNPQSERPRSLESALETTSLETRTKLKSYNTTLVLPHWKSLTFSLLFCHSSDVWG